MENSNSVYSCGACGMKVDVLDGKMKRTCVCNADTTVHANMTVNFKHSGSRAEYYQFLTTAKEFYLAALLLKRENRPSIVYLHLICQAFENAAKYIICESKGYDYCFPNSKENSFFGLRYFFFKFFKNNHRFLSKKNQSGKFGHKLIKLLPELKQDVKYGHFITVELERDIKKLTEPYERRVFAYGNFRTTFFGASEYATESLFDFLEKTLDL